MRKIYTSIDIGSSTIKVVVGEFINSKLNILCANTIETRGIKKGLIVNANDVANSIREVLHNAEKKLLVAIDKVLVIIPPFDASYALTSGEVDIYNEDGKVTGIDIANVLKNSAKLDDDTKRIVSINPIYFNVDGKNTKNPIGLACKKLSVKAMMVSVLKKNVDDILNVFNMLNIDVLDINIGPICDYYELNKDIDDNILSVIINIGYELTTVSLFNKGIIIDSEIIAIGSKNIDNDISYVFKLSKSDSKKLKESFSMAHKKFSRVNDVVEAVTIDNDLINITQYDLTQVVSSRLAEILKLAKKQSYLLTNKEISYIMITGGCSEIPGISYLVEEIFGDIAHVYNMDTIGIRNNMYTTCSGLIRYFDNKMKLRDKNITMINMDDSNDKINIDESSMLGKVFGYFFDS